MYEFSTHIDDFYIAGFKFGEGADVLESLKPGTPLVLALEQDNPYDPNAVAILWSGRRLGYIPAEKNALVSQLLRFGHVDVIGCKVLRVDAAAPTYKQVQVKLYMIDAR